MLFFDFGSTPGMIPVPFPRCIYSVTAELDPLCAAVCVTEPFIPRKFPVTKQLPAYSEFHVMPHTHLIYTATW